MLARFSESVTIPVETLPSDDERSQPGSILYLEAIAEASQELAVRVRETIEAGELALTLGGDHAVSIGSVAGAALAAERLAVIWIDAHADLNWPEVSPSGHVHGMPLAASLGRGPDELTGIGRCDPKLQPQDAYLIGLRNLDPAERDWLRQGEIYYAAMADIDETGLESVLNKVIERVEASGVDAVHLSVDVDALDPRLLPGTGTREWGGFTFREAAKILRQLRASDLPVRSLDVVELNPALDPSDESTDIAARLLATALGETLL